MTYDKQAVQRLLKVLGFDPGPVDGIFGPKTELAVRKFQRSRGFANTGIVGEQTYAALLGKSVPRTADLPWMVLAKSVFGLHETRDNAALRAFLEENDDFELDPYVNAKLLQTSSPQGYLRRRK